MKYLCNNSATKENQRNLRKNQTDAERKLWSILRNRQIRGIKFFRQYSVGPYIIDFYSPTKRLAIEVDGGHHAENGKMRYDDERTNYLTQQGAHVLRFWNNEVLGNIDGVWEKINEVSGNNPS